MDRLCLPFFLTCVFALCCCAAGQTYILGNCAADATQGEICIKNGQTGVCIYPGGSGLFEQLKCVQPQACPIWPAIANGYYVPSDSGVFEITYPQNATLQCSFGFTTQEPVTIFCNFTGEITEPSETCQPIDCTEAALATVANGGFVLSVSGATTFGNSAELVCDAGYELTGNPCVVMCLADGTWSDTTAICTAKQCGDPPCDYLQDAGTDFGDTASIDCPAGYIPSDPTATITCTTDGIWSTPMATCDPIDCTEAALATAANGDFVLSVSGATTFGNSAELVCDAGYELTGNPCVVVCLADGTWSDTTAMCTAKQCGDPPCDYLQDAGTDFGDTASIDCPAGYIPSDPTATITCTTDGIWSTPMATCDPIDCTEAALGAVVNGSFVLSVSGESTLGNTADLVCADGYMSTGGRSLIMCLTDGNWSDTMAVCTAKHCTAKLPARANGAFIPQGDGTFMDIASLECAAGYEVIGGGSSIVCMVDGNWSGKTASCARKDCTPRLPTVTNGAFVTQGDGTFTDIATLECDAGYVVKGGPSAIVCTEEGTWSATAAVCARRGTPFV